MQWAGEGRLHCPVEGAAVLRVSWGLMLMYLSFFCARVNLSQSYGTPEMGLEAV